MNSTACRQIFFPIENLERIICYDFRTVTKHFCEVLICEKFNARQTRMMRTSNMFDEKGFKILFKYRCLNIELLNLCIPILTIPWYTFFMGINTGER